ncbi:MAG: hypothetical protein MJ202_01000 [Lentisphaeria bacterium]|nr:hypothetical protein [Lentisphaeria bacterium]
MRFLLHNMLFWMALFAAILLQAVSVNINLDIDENGALQGSTEYVIPNKSAGLLKGLSRELSYGDNLGPLDEEAVKRHFAQSEAVILDAYHVYTIPNGQRIRLDFSAPSARDAFASGLLGEISLDDAQNPDERLFIAKLPKQTVDWNPQRAAFARKLLEAVDGLEMTLHLQTPTPLQQTTGVVDSSNQCHWRLDLGDLMQKELPSIQARY